MGEIRPPVVFHSERSRFLREPTGMMNRDIHGIKRGSEKARWMAVGIEPIKKYKSSSKVVSEISAHRKTVRKVERDSPSSWGCASKIVGTLRKSSFWR